MPQAARVLAVTAHATPLSPGPGSPDVVMESLPAWRALPETMAGPVEEIAKAVSALLAKPQVTPSDAMTDILRIDKAFIAGGAVAAACGAPGAVAAAQAQMGTLNAANVSLTMAWATATAVSPPVATVAYTTGIKAAAAAAASAVVSAMSGISDMNVCPSFTLVAPGPQFAEMERPGVKIVLDAAPAPFPHGPGFVTRGSPSVIINDLPAARSSDKVAEACGGGNPVVLGCPSILIDDPPPAPAAGFGAVRAPVVATNPVTGVTTATYGPNITIVGTKDFVDATVQYLQTLDGTPSGHLLLESLSSAPHGVTIREAASVQGNTAIPAGGMADPGGWDGNGTDAEVFFYPNQTNMYNSGEDWDSLRPEVGLGHELIHADHIVHGGLPGDPTSGNMLAADPTIDEDVAMEEARTVGMEEDPMYGLPDNSGQPYSENTIRNDLGEPPRMYYNDPALGTW